MTKNAGVPALPWASVIEALRGRSDWASLREALKAQALPTGTGWDDLIGNCAPSQPAAAKLHFFLSSYYKQQLLSGRRYIQLFELEKEVVADLDRTLNAATVPSTAFHASYPLPLSAQHLSGQPDEPQLCEVHKLQSGDWALIFCSARAAEVRESIDPSRLDKRVAAAFPGAHQLIAVRQFSYQAFDMAIIRRKLGRLELCADVHKDVSGVNYDFAILAMFRKLTLHIPDLLPAYQKCEPENLFGALAGLYFGTEGIVKSLAFRTGTGSVKKERMTTSTDDLRDERFHKAGAAAVENKLRPFHVALDFAFKIPKGFAHIDLTASIRELQLETPRLFAFKVEHCDSPASLESAVNKVVKYI